MRKLIAGMKVSLDGKVEGPEGYADWVDAWSEDYGLSPRIDACLLGGGMYPGYEQYWTALMNEPNRPLPMTGKKPTPAEIEWANLIPKIPHHVLSTTLQSAAWPNTRFLRAVDEVGRLKQQPGKDIYLVGGARMTSSLIDAGLVDELHLIVFPLIATGEKSLFSATGSRRTLEFRNVRQRPDGSVSMTCIVQ